MNMCMRVLATLSFAAAFRACGCQFPTLKSVTPTFYQATRQHLNAGLIVEASTSLPVLIIAGGFTITCTSSSLPQTAERRATLLDFLGINEKLHDSAGRSQHLSDSGM